MKLYRSHANVAVFMGTLELGTQLVYSAAESRWERLGWTFRQAIP